MTLDSRIALEVASVLVSDDETIRVPQRFRTVDLWGDGTGNDRANLLWSARRTLAASASDSLDLAGGLTGTFGEAIAFARVKAIIIASDKANTNTIHVGGASSNAFASWAGNANDKLVVRPGGALTLIAPDAAGYPVAAGTGDILKIANSSGGSPVTYDIILIGEEASVYDAAVLADHPIAYWPLSGHAKDLTGNNHTGALVNNPTLTTFPTGERALEFNGTNQYVEIPDDAALSIVTTGELTIEAWMRPDVLNFSVLQPVNPTTASYNKYIYWLGKLGTNESTTNAEYAFREYDKDSYRPSRTSGYVFNLTGDLGAGSYVEEPLTIGEWIHFVLVVDLTKTDWYKNGQLRDSDLLSAFGITPSNGGAPLRIGTATLESFFQGAIAKVAVYGYRLPPDRIIAHRQIVVPGPGFVGHVGHYGTTDSLTKHNLIVGDAGVPAGATLLVKLVYAYTSSPPTCGDSQGNEYAVDVTGTDAGHTVRYALISGQINAPLQPNDIIQVVTPSAVAWCEFTIDQYTYITFSSAFEGENHSSGTSTTPKTAGYTNVQPNALAVGLNVVFGPISDDYTEDAAYVGRTRISISGPIDVTLNSADHPVDISALRKYQPALSTSRQWLAVDAVYKAGSPTIVPPTVGSANHLGNVGTATSTTSGNTLPVTITGDGIAAGNTVLVFVDADWTSGGASATDDRGNTWVRDFTVPATGNTSRTAVLRSALTTALQTGDVIHVAFSAPVTRKSATAEAFTGVLVPTTVDVTNSNSNTGNNPSTHLDTTGLHADDLLVAWLAVEGPATDTIDPDVIHQWSPLTSVGTTGGASASDDRTISPAWKAVATTGDTIFNPGIVGTARKYVVAGVAYQAG